MDFFSAFDREKVVYVAKLAMQAKRYDEATDAMRKVAIHMIGELSEDERNLLSEGYKIKIRTLRDYWGELSRLKEIEFLGRENRNIINDYIHKVETEINGVCHEVSTLIELHLTPSATTPDASVFYFKMLGDYCRYQAEYGTGVLRTVAIHRSFKAYESAKDIAETDLPRAHHVRLGLALNFAVYTYKILGSTNQACKIAKKAFLDAAPGLGRLTQEAYRDSIKIIDLLWDNSMQWKAKAGAGAADDYWSEGEDKEIKPCVKPAFPTTN